jgi:hypothetical protein
MTIGAQTSQSLQSFAGKVNFGPSRQDAPAGSAHEPKLIEQLYQTLRCWHYDRRTEQAHCHWSHDASIFTTFVRATISQSDYNAWFEFNPGRGTLKGLGSTIELFKTGLDHGGKGCRILWVGISHDLWILGVPLLSLFELFHFIKGKYDSPISGNGFTANHRRYR